MFPFIAFAVAPWHAAPRPSTDTQRRIAEVESGLLPPVHITGSGPDRRHIGDEMERLHVPAVSIAVIHGGKLEWAKGYGVQRVGGPPVTPSTIFQAASISKSLTSMAALHLVEQGKLALDEPIQTELKSWTPPSNPFISRQAVTLRELLSHTAGINVHGFVGYAAGEPVPTLVQVLNGQKPANSDPIVVEAVPGSQFNYSGGGFTIVQQAIIDTTGQGFPDFMKATVLGPLGMKASTFQQPLDSRRLKQAALPVDPDGKPVPGGPHTYPEMAAAGLWTTASDLAKWVVEMQKSLAGKANRVLTAATTRTMLTAVRDDYGLGVEIHGTSGKRSFAHSGANVGYQAYYVGYEDGDGAVVLTAGENGQALIEEILRGLAQEYAWPDFQQVQRTEVSVPLAELQQFTGKFSAKDAYDFTVIARDGRLELELPFGPHQLLLSSSRTSFFILAGTLQMLFDTPDHGVLTFGDQKVPFERMR